MKADAAAQVAAQEDVNAVLEMANMVQASTESGAGARRVILCNDSNSGLFLEIFP